MPANDKIRVPDYNDIRNKVVNVLGLGSGNSGYGQTIRSSAVSESTKVSVNEWGNLRWDIINAYTHIYGSAPTTVLPAEGNTVRYSNTFVPDTGASDAPNTQYNTYADTIIANRFTVHPSQSATLALTPSSTTWPGPYGNSWNNKIECTITMLWPDPNAARFFFNSGGQVRISSSRSGGSNTAQCTAWTSLLSSAGTVSFGANNPGTGTTPANGQNWFRLTNSFQPYYSTFSSSPYGTNNYRISARIMDGFSNESGNSKELQFYIEWIDGYVDPGVQPGSTFPQGTAVGSGTAGGGVQTATPADFPPDDAVDGTFTVSVSLLYATGVLVPAGAGNFTVTLPPTAAIGIIKTP